MYIIEQLTSVLYEVNFPRLQHYAKQQYFSDPRRNVRNIKKKHLRFSVSNDKTKIKLVSGRDSCEILNFFKVISTMQIFLTIVLLSISFHTMFRVWYGFLDGSKTFTQDFLFTRENAVYNIQCIKTIVLRSPPTKSKVCPCALCTVIAKAALIGN